MPEGKDFVDGLLAGAVVDAIAGVEGSFKCSPAGLLRRRRNKRRIAMNVLDIRIWTARWRYLDVHVKIGFESNVGPHRKTGEALIRQG